jgi:hypothetical protein
MQYSFLTYFQSGRGCYSQYIYPVEEKAVNAAAEFLKQHPDILPIFIVELYNSIHHFTSSVHGVKTMDYYLADAYPKHVGVASSTCSILYSY